jgi:hypothetical protein
MQSQGALQYGCICCNHCCAFTPRGRTKIQETRHVGEDECFIILSGNAYVKLSSRGSVAALLCQALPHPPEGATRQLVAQMLDFRSV